MTISARAAALVPEGLSGQLSALRQVTVTAWLRTGSHTTISPSRLVIITMCHGISTGKIKYNRI